MHFPPNLGHAHKVKYHQKYIILYYVFLISFSFISQTGLIKTASEETSSAATTEQTSITATSTLLSTATVSGM